MEPTSGARCPVVDFDHDSPEHARNWVSEFREMRERSPIAWTERHGGYWVITRYHDVIAIAQNTAVFKSGKTFDPDTGHVEGGVNIPPAPMVPTVPTEADEPLWQELRSLLNRKFAPKAVEERRTRVRRFATFLMNRVIAAGEMDLIRDLTGPLPAMTTMDLLGLPLHEWREMSDPMHELVYWPKTDPAYLDKVRAYDWCLNSVGEELRKRRKEPQDDLLTHIIGATIEGVPITDELAIQIVSNIIAGGVDTTTNLTGHVLKYLSDHPAERQRLIDNPEMLPVAREEFVRYFSPVHCLARNASADVEVGGTTIHAGERVLLAYGSANRDPAIFADADQLDMTRFPNRHIGFGAGMHRCLGSFLARIMFEVMITEVLTRIPDYRVSSDLATPYPSITTINGWVDMPAVFTPGEPVHCDLVI